MTAPVEPAVAEPLAESAPLAWEAAPRLCPPDPETGVSCMAYHRVWQYLRLLGVMASTRINSMFMIDVFRQHARTGAFPRALVSATADYSMLAHLVSAYAAEDARLDATVIDRCETALFLNRWYAARLGASLKTTRVQVQDYESATPFDLICTHNFLSRFSPDVRRQVIARWHALLRPGGIIITTQRIQPRTDSPFNFHTEEQARALGERVRAAASAFTDPLEVSPEALGAAAYAYSRHHRTFVIRTTRDLLDVFDAVGFDLVLADEGGGDAERQRDRSIFPQEGSFRMRIVARKR